MRRDFIGLSGTNLRVQPDSRLQPLDMRKHCAAGVGLKKTRAGFQSRRGLAGGISDNKFSLSNSGQEGGEMMLEQS